MVAIPLEAQPPKARVDEVTDVLHGVPVRDPYRWLEDGQSAETRAWVGGQMKHTRALLDARPERAQFKQRLAELMQVESIAPPKARNGRYFYVKRGAKENRQAIYLRPSATSEERKLVDPAKVSADENVSVHLLDVSQDGRLLAYGVRDGGKDEQVVRVLDVESGQTLPASLPAANYLNVNFAPKGDLIFVTTIDAKGPAVLRYTVSDGKGAKIFGDGYGPDKIAIIQLSPDGRMLVINVAEGSSGERGEVWLSRDGGKPKLLAGGLGARVFGSAAGGHVFLFTNWNAPRNRMFRVDPDRPERHFWKLIVPEAPDQLEGANFAGNGLVLVYLRNANTRLMQVDADGRYVRDVPLPGLGSAYIAEDRWGEQEYFVSFSSFTTPPTVLRVEGGNSSVWARQTMPLDPEKFEVKQEWYRSKDGTRVPMFVVSAKGTPRDGERPVLLTGYGGFAVSNTPYFSASAIPWIERGGVFALANLRGGAEFGEEWHKAGTLDRKQNVFDDFAAAAEWLIANKYTKPEKLAIEGGSNGGLLVGAALTQRPELFGAVLCAVPLLDMIRYQMFSIARLWVPEYGSSENEAQFAYLLKYSPYHNVRAGVKYPPVMFFSGDSDTRVDPLHARKMAALMQSHGADALLHYDTNAGHSGGLPVNKQIDDNADVLTFLWWKLHPAAPAQAGVKR